MALPLLTNGRKHSVDTAATSARRGYETVGLLLIMRDLSLGDCALILVVASAPGNVGRRCPWGEPARSSFWHPAPITGFAFIGSNATETHSVETHS